MKHLRMPKIPDKELLELFPEAKEEISEKHKEWKRVSNHTEKKVKKLLNELYARETDEFSEWFIEELIKVEHLPSLAKSDKQVNRLQRLMSHYQKDTKHIENYEQRLENARNYPIKVIAYQNLDIKKYGDNYISRCPFHEEKSPSFYIYTNSNSFHCYGCQKHGDVIELVMCLYGADFKKAIEILQN